MSKGAAIGGHDNSTISKDEFHPLVPNVTIQYRCGDSLRTDNAGYGLLPFPTIISRIPEDAKSIYIISDAVKRVGDNARYDYHQHCRRILGWLHSDVRKAFPDALVLTKRGGDPFLDLLRITHSNTTICSTSTFCFYGWGLHCKFFHLIFFELLVIICIFSWRALGARGKVYFPETRLISRPDEHEHFTFQSLGLDFNWIDEKDGKLLSLVIWHPWYSIMYGLTKKDFDTDDHDGRVMQGNAKKLWYVYKDSRSGYKKRKIPDTDTMDSLGLHWYRTVSIFNSWPHFFFFGQIHPLCLTSIFWTGPTYGVWTTNSWTGLKLTPMIWSPTRTAASSTSSSRRRYGTSVRSVRPHSMIQVAEESTGMTW